MGKDKEYWIFTFGEGHAYPGYYVKIYGTYGEARVKMVNELPPPITSEMVSTIP